MILNNTSASGHIPDCAREFAGYALAFACAIITLIMLSRQAHVLDVFQLIANHQLPNADATPLWLIVPAACAAGMTPPLFQRLLNKLWASICAIGLVLLLGSISISLLWLPVLIYPCVFAILRASSVLMRPTGYQIPMKFTLPIMPSALPCATALIVVFAFAAYYRWHALLAALPAPLEPDAVTYLNLARISSGFATDHRESLFIWLVQFLGFCTGGYSETGMRLFSVCFSFVTLTVLFMFACRHIGLSAAFLAGWIYAVSPAFDLLSVRGLREEVVIAAFLSFASVYMTTWRRVPTMGSYLLLSLTGALLIYCRLTNLPFVVLVCLIHFGYSAFVHKLPLKQYWLLISLLTISTVPITPYLIYSKNKFGDPFYAVSVHTQWFANYEFAGKHPDFVSHDEFLRNGNAGKSVSSYGYMFKYHTLPEVIQRTLAGIWMVYIWDYPVYYLPNAPQSLLRHLPQSLTNLMLIRTAGGQTKALWPFYFLHLAGLAVMLAPVRRLLPMLVFISHLPLFFLLSLPGIDLRMLTIPYAVFCIGCGAVLHFIMSLHVDRPLRFLEKKEPAG